MTETRDGERDWYEVIHASDGVSERHDARVRRVRVDHVLWKKKKKNK